MAEIRNVCIGIQARSTSERFPRKVFELIDGKPILKHVIDACDKSALYINHNTHKTKIMATVVVLVPYGDEIIGQFKNRAILVEGPENDVLARYYVMANRMDADYIVRITADCPLIPPFLITKHINTAVLNSYDYVSNVDPDYRTAPDGLDCEVISKKLLKHVYETSTQDSDREHVTTFIRREPPDWAKIGHVIGFQNQAHMKLSVDTYEDLERVRAHYDSIKRMIDDAESKHGKNNVHRF